MKADFAMALHFHQPVGNFDHVIERACCKCYAPFLETLKKYPDIKMTFHFTGCLLEWIEEKKPQIIETIKSLVESGQVEVMSGAFYEPILPSIPLRDQTAQITMSNEYVRTRFSSEPKGAWIAERVWEPALPSVLHDAGIKYVILDETHFLYSGVKKEKTYGYYTTEDNGKEVAVFPSDKVLRYTIPFRMPNESIDYMKSVSGRSDNPTFIYGDDGEKFGEWPGTHKWVFEEKWLEKFFDELGRNKDWLHTKKLSECLEEKKSIGHVYLSTSSYEEMLEWALPAESQLELEKVKEDLRQSGKEELYRPFLRGGFWRNFLAKYPESDHMHKKMIYASEKLNGLRKKKKNKTVLAEAEKELLRGQCNCAYWHGVFGGLYLFHLRRAIYHHLIKAEKLMDKARYGSGAYSRSSVLDVDADGLDEVVLENKDISLYFDPADGGALKEMDSKAVCHNLINTLARRKEVYHEDILQKIGDPEAQGTPEVKTIHEDTKPADPGIKDHLSYDRHGRWCFIDHFLKADTDIGSFARCDYHEAGDFADGKYDFDVKKSIGGLTLVLGREGKVDGVSVSLSKEVIMPKRGAALTVKYRIKNNGENAVNLIFGPELNLTMPDADSDAYSLSVNRQKEVYRLGDTLENEEVTELEIKDADKRLSMKISFSEKCRFWSFPLKTVSQSEKAYELNYQGTMMLPHLKMTLDAGEEKRFIVKLRLAAGR